MDSVPQTLGKCALPDHEFRSAFIDSCEAVSRAASAHAACPFGKPLRDSVLMECRTRFQDQASCFGLRASPHRKRVRHVQRRIEPVCIILRHETFIEPRLEGGPIDISANENDFLPPVSPRLLPLLLNICLHDKCLRDANCFGLLYLPGHGFGFGWFGLWSKHASRWQLVYPVSMH